MSDPIRTALAELVRLEDEGGTTVEEWEAAHDAARAALAEQPSVQDVDWEELAEDVLRQEREDHAARDAMSRQPSVREPLSEDRIGELEHAAWSESEETDWFAVLAFARMVEAAHGIGEKGEA